MAFRRQCNETPKQREPVVKSWRVATGQICSVCSSSLHYALGNPHVIIENQDHPASAYMLTSFAIAS